jgi:hypothetical protein
MNNNNKSKIIKYLLFGLINGIMLRYIPSSIIKNRDILIISLLMSILFAIMDMISPSIKIKN